MKNLTTGNPPPGIFVGRNIMTPDWLGYYKLRAREGYAELSEGRGIYDEPIFGVTVRVATSPGDPNKRSRLFHNKAEALEYIASLS